MTDRTPPPADRTATLVHDGALRLTVASELAGRVAGWLPRSIRFDRSSDAAATTPAGHVDVRVAGAAGGADDAPRPDGAPVLTFMGVGLWHAGADAMVLAAHPAGGADVTGRLDLARRCATLHAAPGPGDGVPSVALPAALTLAAAYLLGRASRALLHAAALVAPDGRAWLLVGDSHAGKSTTCATLLDAGWGYCADDHVIVGGAAEGGLAVEGWPRILHLDRGWSAGTPAGGAREAVDALARWPDRWRRTAPLAGALFPRVAADRPTALEPLAPAARLAALVRQSPWFLGDPVAAPAILALLARVAGLPGATLRLGVDSFRRPARLADALAPLVAPLVAPHAPVPGAA